MATWSHKSRISASLVRAWARATASSSPRSAAPCSRKEGSAAWAAPFLQAGWQAAHSPRKTRAPSSSGEGASFSFRQAAGRQKPSRWSLGISSARIPLRYR